MGRDRKAKSVDLDTLADLIDCGMTRKQIAEETGMSVVTIGKVVSELKAKQGILLEYKALQTLQLTELQAKLLAAITPDKIAEASLRDLVLAYKVLKDKELVGDGKPTEIKGLVAYLIELEKQEMTGGLATPPIEVVVHNVTPMLSDELIEPIGLEDEGLPNL